MFTIGVFASLGRVSVRMLRHYDSIGLLVPAHVDDTTGYRYYDAAQLRRLNRLVALKDLGFTLEQTHAILDEKIDVAELQGMLRLRRAQLRDQIKTDSERLDRVETRLRLIETEGTMSTRAVAITSHDSIEVAEVSGTAESTSSDDIAPVIGPLFTELFSTVDPQRLRGTPIATYTPLPDGRLRVAACAPVSHGDARGLNHVTLPALPRVASYIHHGRMASISEAYQALATWIDDTGHRTDGTARETYLVSHPEPEVAWQTQITMPLLDSHTV